MLNSIVFVSLVFSRLALAYNLQDVKPKLPLASTTVTGDSVIHITMVFEVWFGCAQDRNLDMSVSKEKQMPVVGRLFVNPRHTWCN